ncbi:hypothetical protein [Limosilactobacillus fermentum]|uniref:Uncharacterized protein n=1 Tax=Lactobacillus phage LF1 TaxID=947980 RepID=E9LUK0_9CAUD|nr:hypothetical protein [Limosilactobacillus fermentum]YP_007003222.1 hypothetical protein F374_gp22 [Lactobacillus phage LF1]ADW01246.1 hypothetical protein [Lactobacillus phage LF1]UVW04104.1 hypothetical protein NX839_03355 [Limosilactobacillus fermentum]WEN04721.1 hypothetical protein P0M30_06090 [Limosilactobacillus fermentum]WEN11576.1 hypothetical protein P0N62_06100 [Limosilactobacillus fermentum]WJD38231.1 hypothetical protein QRA02_06095 [Limosilactobacillus fermentum]
MVVEIDEATKKWVIDGVVQDVSAVGQSGATPTIDLPTGHWFISGNDTGIQAIGKDGKDGESAYQLAVDNGYPSDLDTWLASLKGNKGEKGDTALSVKVGSVTSGDTTTVTNSGTSTNLVLDFTFAQKDLEGLASYATKTDLTAYATKQALTSYYTSAQMDTKLSAKADLAMIANIADKDTVQTLSNKVDQLNAQVNSQAQTMIKLQDQINTVLAKLKTTTTTTA